MILIDTSVWVDHFREPIEEVERLAAAVLLVQHPFVTGELAVGTLKNSAATLTYLSEDLPKARMASETEFLAFVANERISGIGIGFVDAHLLASCRLMPGTLLWSRDKRLERWAEDAGVGWSSR
ncbi:MAG TPA: type II toxin-antitoxin system VapC family toxin [Allosphingosinicella sp.]|nr:type II toxin-antitoxin system VapC family toxin [Allosphingosinicella sp.]